MDTATNRLLRIAHRLADALALVPTVQAVALTGSAATGTADDSSDVDLIVLHTAMPALPALSAVRTQVNGSERLYSSAVQDTARYKEGYFLNGVRCDLSHLTLTALEDDLALVLDAHSTDAHAQSRVAGNLECLPLFGNSLLLSFSVKPLAILPNCGERWSRPIFTFSRSGCWRRWARGAAICCFCIKIW